MSRPSDVAAERFDAAGFEVPFASSFEGEVLSESEATFETASESPFAESRSDAEDFESEGFDSESLEEADSWSQAEAEYHEAPLGEDETFPSGLVLQPASGATGRDQEYWDPHQTGVALLATGPDVQSQKISPHFTVRELVTSGGKAAAVARISSELVRVLELIRERAGKAVRITSGYRSWKRNKAVYAARGKKPTDSRHCSGQAADISIKGMSGLALGKLAIDAAGTNLGIGIGNTFIHVDVRGSWAMWTYFPRGGDADRKALAELSAHRARALRGGRPAPVPPAPKPLRKQPAPVPIGTPSGRLVVAQHPMLRKHKGTPPDLILRWHGIAQPGDIDVVVHFHGYGYKGQKTDVRIDRDKEKISGLDFTDPASLGSAGRTRPTLALLPRGNYFGGSRENGYNFPALMPRGALQQLIRDALARVTQATGHTVQMGRLILTAHSGGGAPLTAVLAHTDPDEIHIFDGLYGSGQPIGDWAQRRIAKDLPSPATPPPALRVLYLPGTKQYPGTQPNSEALARQIYPTLSSPAAARLQPYFRVEKTDVGHNDIPATFGWRLLADAGANVPRATLYSGAPGVTREASFEGYEETEESFEPEVLESEGQQLAADETLAWLDVEALTGAAAAEPEEEEEHEEEWEEGEAEAEAEAVAEWEHAGNSEDEIESYEQNESEGEAEAALSEAEWSEQEEQETEAETTEQEAQEAEEFVGRFDAFGDERDTEWELGEEEASFEDEGPLAGSGLTTAEQKAVEITSLFETGKRGGFYGLSGNFDGQGLSFGLVNWTIGTGSLQPLLRDFAREQPTRWAQVFGPHAPAFLMVITPNSKAATKVQLKFAREQMNTVALVNGKQKWSIKEPWVTYFKRLSEDLEFQQIQVRYVRGLLKRAGYFCEYFKLKSEMAFAYMFDAVSSHGKWWLTKRFAGREKRRIEIEAKLAALTAQHEGSVPETEILLAIADVLSATSAARWAAHVRRRKRWFVTGEHPRAKELKGLEPRADVPYATSETVERDSESVDEAAPVAEMESRSTASKLELVPGWRKLLLMKVGDGIRTALAKRKMRVQYAHNESYSNDLNFDLYPVRINRFPTKDGTVMTPANFVKYVRLNLNSFLDTSLSRFYPYSIAEAARWGFDNPVGIVLKIDIPMDNAAVVVSSATPTGWVFSTVTTPGTGTHPVSGHRTFFLAQRDGAYYFINKGLDMTSSGIAGLGLPIVGSIGYGKADTLWKGLQDKLTQFINANGGEAKKETRISERVEWRYVYHRYGKELERVFGKGAGSARNSPFFDITDESTQTSEDIAGESELADDARAILGKWTVRLKDWVWEYDFLPGGRVTWRDTRGSDKGEGRWAVSPKAINISWTNSATTESWARPLTPARQTAWYKSTYYTGRYQPQKVVPVRADGIEPYRGGGGRSGGGGSTDSYDICENSSWPECQGSCDAGKKCVAPKDWSVCACWSPEGEHETDEVDLAGESELADDARVILGKWTVRLKDWVWEYDFLPGGKVTWRDTRSSEKGEGRWVASPKAINLSWTNSTTTESWARPLTPARQMGWYKSTYYTGSYQPQKVGAVARGGAVPAWADAIDPFPGTVTLAVDRSNASMTSAFAPIATSSSNHLCAALGDVTSGASSVPFAAHRETEMVFVGSLLKIGVMYAAFALRARVQAFANAARANGVTTAGDLFPLIKRAWTPKLKALFPGRPTQSFKNSRDMTVPQVDRIFTLSAAGKIEFASASPAITLADLDSAGEFGTPQGLFHQWMRLMMRWSNNEAASRCVLALGYFYINGLFAQSGFFAAGKGLWVSGDYAGHDWVRTTQELAANAGGVALDPRWATAQKRTKSNFVGNALQIGRLMTAMAQDKLLDAASCDEMRKLANQLAGGIGSYAGSALAGAGRSPTALSSKIGFGDDSFSHDCAIVERTIGTKRIRYAAVVLGSAPSQMRRDLSEMFVLLDDAVVARNP